MNKVNFSEAKKEFEKKNIKILKESFVPENGKFLKNIKLVNEKGQKIEQYYKWEFIYCVIESGLFDKSLIGTEIHFPKGSPSSKNIEIDLAIFTNKSWIKHYNNYQEKKDTDSLDWLRENLILVGEFKKNHNEISEVFNNQIKPAIKEKEPGDSYLIGCYYDNNSLYLFQRKNGVILRYDEGKNLKGDKSKLSDMTLHIPDSYSYIPSFNQILNKINKTQINIRSERTLEDLEEISSIQTNHIQNSLSNILRTMDKNGLVNQKGYQILIECFALKIFDEKNNKKLKFFLNPDEKNFANLSSSEVRPFIDRIKSLHEEAQESYSNILTNKNIDWKNEAHVKVIQAYSENFQDYSFLKSVKSDLYQLIFYNFANAFTRNEAGQFLTPLPIINFLVQIVNPTGNEKVIDPCCGIGDFLSVAFVNSLEKSTNKLNDNNLYGFELEQNMTILATLNMILNGDGLSKINYDPNLGSILNKYGVGNPFQIIQLDPTSNKDGKWHNRNDELKLLKFDAVLTNPPFGDDRSWQPKSNFEKGIASCYETWNLIDQDRIDLGIIFLENAIQILKDNGRFGIILSNSIASIERWEIVRKWLLTKIRLIAVFDLPEKVFAETDTNTTIIVGYKPKSEKLNELIKKDYSIFTKEIKEVGYEKRTLKRNVFFKPKFKFDEETFDIKIDKDGNPVLEEELTETVSSFREWLKDQEIEAQEAFNE